MSFGLDDVFEHEGMEFVRLAVHGQSFMLHQIRKMMGLVTAICQGIIPESFLLGEQTAFTFDRCHTQLFLCVWTSRSFLFHVLFLLRPFCLLPHGHQRPVGFNPACAAPPPDR